MHTYLTQHFCDRWDDWTFEAHEKNVVWIGGKLMRSVGINHLHAIPKVEKVVVALQKTLGGQTRDCGDLTNW